MNSLAFFFESELSRLLFSLENAFSVNPSFMASLITPSYAKYTISVSLPFLNVLPCKHFPFLNQ